MQAVSLKQKKTIMGQSLSQLYVHLTFATKFRQPLIRESIEDKLHAYMAGILKNMESPALIINSMPDHIHILFRLSKNFALVKVVEIVKKDSTKWIKTEWPDLSGFSWQIGYGAFSVSSYALETVINYIKGQKQHHHVQTYQNEIEDYVRKHDLNEYDERYFWD
jgi:putative transposase